MKFLTHAFNKVRARGNRLAERINHAVTAVTVSLLASPAMAALPQAVQPGQGVGAGDYIALAQDYFKKGFLFLGLLLAAYGLYTVAGGAIAKFNDFRIGRAELSDVVVYAVVGVVILVILIYLLTEASTIL